jgi:hypothetical protein
LSTRSASSLLNLCRLPHNVSYSSIGGILFFVIEMRLLLDGKDNVAQLFLELLCKSLFASLGVVNLYTAAAETNRTARFEGLRVYGLLTDLLTFKFYSYDPIKKRFAFDEMIMVNVSREILVADMIRGMCSLYDFLNVNYPSLSGE